MGFKFREKEKMELPYKCLEISGDYLIQNQGRFPFHESPNLGEGWALCHRYSFDSMSKYLCWCYGEGNPFFVRKLIDLMYDPNDNDYLDALRIYSKLERSNTAELWCRHLNELLYVLNNARINLRAGNQSWNCSIGPAYDPESWILIDNDSKILITSFYDIRIIKGLRDVPVYPSTVFFYTAQDKKSGRPFLYSSNNNFSNKGTNEYNAYSIPIYIYSDNRYIKVG